MAGEILPGIICSMFKKEANELKKEANDPNISKERRQAIKDFADLCDDTIVKATRDLWRENELQITIENLLDDLKDSVSDIAEIAGFPDIGLSDEELRLILRTSFTEQEEVTPFIARMDPLKVDQPIFDRAQKLSQFEIIRKGAGLAHSGGPVGASGPSRGRDGRGAPETLEERGIFLDPLLGVFDDDGALDDFTIALAETREAGEAMNIVLHEMREASGLMADDFAELTEAGSAFGNTLFGVDEQSQALVTTIEAQNAELGELVESYGLSADAAGAFSEEARDAARDVESAMANAFGSIASIVDRVMADGEADWRDFGRVALGVIEDILNAQLSASGSGGGDFFSTLFGLAGDLLGAVFGGGSGGGGGNPGNPHLLGFAAGGIAPAGQLALVGEQGPELIIPNTSSLVIPNDLSEALVAGGGGNTDNSVHNHFNIDARGAGPDVKKLIQQGIEESLPMIVKVTQGMILRDARRGGAFARMKRV